MLSRFVQFFSRQTLVTLILWIGLFLFGSFSYLFLLPREGFPSVDIPIALGNGVWFVDDVEQVDELVTPIAEDLLTDDDVTTVTTVSRESIFTIIAEFEESVSSADGAAKIDAAVGRAGLPPEVDFSAEPVDAARFLNEFDLLVGVVGDGSSSPAELQGAAEAIAPFFGDHPDVARVEVLDLADTAVDPATGEELSRVARFNQLSVGTGSDTSLVPSIAVGLVSAEGVDSLAIRDAADAALDDIDSAAALPAGFDATVAIDQATQIRQQISSLQSNVLTGVVAVAFIALLLISWRASIITALFLVTVIAVTMLVLWLFGISLSTISLFGIILALGLFVDDSIVITEAIDAFRDEGSSPIEIIGQAIRRVGAASVSGTVTTLLVFAPMLAISGVLGDFIRILPISVIIALTVSLVLSLVVIPFAARYLVLSAPPAGGPIARFQDRLADMTASLPGRGGGKGTAIGIAGFLLSILMTVVGIGVFAPRVGFNIFPPQKDSNFVAVEYTFDPGTTVEEAEAIARATNQAAADVLGDDLDRVYTYLGNARGASAQFELTEMGSRERAPIIVDEVLQPIGDDVDGARVVFSQLSAGPPELLFPFQMQLFANDDDALLNGAETIQSAIDGTAIERPNGTTFTVVETQITLVDSITRQDGRRYVELQARFDADDITTTTAETQAFIEDEFDTERLAELGLEADALGFDFGLESDNQESFSSMPRAFMIALGLMLILLVVQFRSSIQWLLVFLAIPFSFFGVFGGLLLTDNQISFFVMLGLLGLIGIAVNNTILLTDFANQERAGGATRQEAIREALRRRFRPLIATTLTTVAGVLPLALSDPFWEALGFTIIFGLLSSTFLVLLSFPYYYLAFEWLRDTVKTPWRRKVVAA
ncbi:MAG: efflux RND transporter permease subunit [Actinomycetota bacterium]